MSKDKDEITIMCPLCSTEHRYRLAVDRSHVLYSMSRAPSSSESRYKTFTRLFACLRNGQRFQAVIRLEETFGTIVNGVKVVS